MDYYYQGGQKVRDKKTGKVYDFGYLSATPGRVVLYEEGEQGMQSSCAFYLSDIEPVVESPSAEVIQQEQADPPIPSRVGGKRPDGYEVARWPEFIALAKRLGISLDLPWTAVEIRIALDEVVKIKEEYFADDIDQKHRKHAWEVAVENTTIHNKEFRTFQPHSLRESEMIVYKQRSLKIEGQDILESLSSPNGNADEPDQEVKWTSGKKTIQSRAEKVEDARRSVLQVWGFPIDVKIEDVTQTTTEGPRTAQ